MTSIERIFGEGKKNLEDLSAAEHMAYAQFVATDFKNQQERSKVRMNIKYAFNQEFKERKKVYQRKRDEKKRSDQAWVERHRTLVRIRYHVKRYLQKKTTQKPTFRIYLKSKAVKFKHERVMPKKIVHEEVIPKPLPYDSVVQNICAVIRARGL